MRRDDNETEPPREWLMPARVLRGMATLGKRIPARARARDLYVTRVL